MTVKQHGMKGKKNALKSEDQVLNSQIFCRCRTEQKGAWVQAAKRNNSKLCPWILKTLDEAAKI